MGLIAKALLYLNNEKDLFYSAHFIMTLVIKAYTRLFVFLYLIKDYI